MKVMLGGIGKLALPSPPGNRVTRKEGRNMRITTRTRRGGHLHGTADGRRLATARGAGNGERGVLAVLRALCPRRSLGIQEAAIVAELQANRLLELAGLQGPPTPEALITELPRHVVRSDVDLPVSGSAQWVNGRWLISVCGSEPLERQRFSLAHEFKHTLDHRFAGVLYRDRGNVSAEEQVELAADMFAACLLMPRMWVKRAWGEGHQSLGELADLFQVSAPAMSRRLAALGLRETPQRCANRREDDHRRPGRSGVHTVEVAA